MSLSADNENPLDMLAINAASAALMISDIPLAVLSAQCALALWTANWW
jgi:polyribonucleotide nucleotidyltransferase